MDRRSFIGSIAALGLQGALLKTSSAKTLLEDAAAGDKWRNKKKRDRFDEDLIVFITDLHTNPDGYQPDKLRRVVADILKMAPLPKNVIALGDLAYLTGKPSEYALLKEIITPIEDAGIHLTMAMGNHDRRENFAAAFPKLAAESKLSDRMVFIVETPKADVIVLDSLQQGDDDTTWITPGALDEAQLKWLEKTLAGYKKPVFVSSHHPIAELKIQGLLADAPTCSGYIYGHNHVWDPGWAKKNYSSYNVVRTLCLPSTGHWGDIGYAEFHLGEETARCELHQYEFFFPKPLQPGMQKPQQWTFMEEEHKGAACSFSYKKI